MDISNAVTKYQAFYMARILDESSQFAKESRAAASAEYAQAPPGATTRPSACPSAQQLAAQLNGRPCLRLAVAGVDWRCMPVPDDASERITRMEHLSTS